MYEWMNEWTNDLKKDIKLKIWELGWTETRNLGEMYDENWLAISPSKYQEIGCSSLSFDYTSAMGLSSNSFSVSDFYSTKSLSIKRRCSLSTDPPIITQDARSPGQPTPPFIPETLSVRGRDIIAALSNDHLVSKHWKKLFKAAPLKSMDAGLQQSNALYATGMNEKEIESADLSSWFWTNCFRSRWTCLTHF